MKKTNINRRDFSKLTVAALGGMVAGTAIGCGGDDAAKTPPAKEENQASTPDEETPTEEDSAEKPTEEGGTDVALLMEEPHVCRGLNTCKGKGAGKENTCAGQGTCSTAEAHSCGNENACKGQGGCGESAGINTCKGVSGCHVPLSEDTWTKVRAAFEKTMTESGKEVGAAPEAA